MQSTDLPPLLLRDLITQLPIRGHELLYAIHDPEEKAASLLITGARGLELATESHLVFCRNGDESLVRLLLQCRSFAIVTTEDVFVQLPDEFVRMRIFLLTPQPRLLLALLLGPFDRPSSFAGQCDAVHPSAQIAGDVTIARGVVIGPHVTIQAGCAIGPNTVVDHAKIGAGTRIGPNCTIGGDGFGFEMDEETGEIVRFPHFGSVQIGERVEIAANVTVDRGSLRDTVIEDEVKIDNLTYIAHNCHIKHGALIMANATLLGSVVVGPFGWIAPSTTILNRLTVGRCGMTGAGSVVVDPVGPNEVVVGVPARRLRSRFSADSPLLKDDAVAVDRSNSQ
jgi:UDP-3-O-[3-hydroxymyristoyl] glucosamine N-acyltransferase LpxD